MGGEDKEKNITKTSGKTGHGEKIFDTSMSRLLQDFNSAELFPNGPEASKGASLSPDLDCETVVTSMKHLHLRRPTLNKHRKMKTSVLKKKMVSNSFNLAVAATGFQRPIVWPARLSNYSDKCNSNILRPSRLCMNKRSTRCEDNTVSSRSLSNTGNLLQDHGSIIFGSTSSVDYSGVSFSCLCKPTSLKMNEVQDKILPTNTEYVKVLCKRHSTSDTPPAKFARKFDKVNGMSNHQTVFLDYRTPSSMYLGCDMACQPLPVTYGTQGHSTNTPLCTDDAASSPSCLETLTTLRSALTDESLPESSSLPFFHEPTLDETNVNELASYFDDLLHIPRKMSTMAEMMYA